MPCRILWERNWETKILKKLTRPYQWETLIYSIKSSETSDEGTKKIEDATDQQPSSKSYSIYNIGGDEAHGNTKDEGDSCQEINLIDSLVKILSRYICYGIVTDPEGIAGQAEKGGSE